MMVFLKRAAAILILLFACWFCQKRMFGYIEVRGRLVHFYTREPIAARVDLLGDDATSAKNSTEHSITLTSETSKADGTFNLRSKPSKRAAYYLSIYGESLLELSVQANKKNDLGDIEAGIQTFICKIRLVPVSDSCIGILNTTQSASPYTTFSSGSTSSLIQEIRYGKAAFENNKHKIIISYRKSTNCNSNGYYDYKYYAAEVPITAADTINVTIPY